MIQTMTLIIILSIAISPLNLLQTLAQTSDETWNEYIDPEGEFSIQYPSTWDIKPLNRFEPTDLYLYSPDGVETGYGMIQYNIFSEEIENVLDNYGGDQSDIEKYLEKWFPSFLQGVKQSV